MPDGIFDWLSGLLPDIGVPGPGWYYGGPGWPPDIPGLASPYPPVAPGIAYSWNTGTATFYRLTDGRIAVQRKDGTWKIWRPRFHNPAKPPKKMMKAANRFISAAKAWKRVGVAVSFAKKARKRKSRR